MWDQVTPADIERAKHRLARSRAEMLIRHEKELNELNVDQDELEILARLIAAFAKKHLLALTPPSTVAEQNSSSPSDTNVRLPKHSETTSSLRSSRSSMKEHEMPGRLAASLPDGAFSIAGLIAMLNSSG